MNPIWGAPRIHSELMKLDIKISQASIAKYVIVTIASHNLALRSRFSNAVLLFP